MFISKVSMDSNRFAIKKTTNKQCQTGNNIAFGTKLLGMKRALVFFSLVFTPLLGQKHSLSKDTITLSHNINLQPKDTTITEEYNEELFAKNIGWEKNVKVLAASGQNLENDGAYKYCYSINLADQASLNSLEKANDYLMKRGYFIGKKKYWPLETPERELNIFNINDKNKNRFVLVFSQNYDEEETFIHEAADIFTSKIQKIYDIPKSNIIRIKAHVKEDFINGIDSMARKIDEFYNCKEKSLLNLANIELESNTYLNQVQKEYKALMNLVINKHKKNDTELLILYNGHGSSMITKEAEQDAIYKEGAKTGRILAEFDDKGNRKRFLTDKEVQSLFKKKLNNIKTLLVMDCCDAGAWIAQSDKVNKTLKLLQYIA